MASTPNTSPPQQRLRGARETLYEIKNGEHDDKTIDEK